MTKHLATKPERPSAPPERRPGPRNQISRRGKTLRAYRAYLDLLDTARWFRTEMKGQLESFGLTMGGFRVLEMLLLDGPTHVGGVARKVHSARQNLEIIVEQLEERGWLRREAAILPPVKMKESRISIAKRSERRKGYRVTLLCLTPSGTQFIADVFPKHVKVVKSFMHVLDGREQETLSRLLQKLRVGDIVRFVREITMDRYEEEC
jgi:MarR family transcriptional regulator, 2-MHQ and catechol-resistance regulon repressor